MKSRPPPPTPLVRYVASGGHRLAWSASGSGSPALVIVPGWVTHLTIDWTQDPIGTYHRTLAAGRRLIRYDRPGIGLADRTDYDFSLERQLEYLDTLLEAAGEDQVALMGHSFSGPIAIAYAATRPEKVSHLVLFATAARLIGAPDFPEGLNPKLAAAIEQLVLAEWGLASRAIAEIMLPGVDPERVEWFAEYQRTATTAEVAAEIIRVQGAMDVREMLPRVQVPTRVLHRQDDRAVTLAAARHLAAGIGGARLKILPGAANLPFYEDMEAIVEEIDGSLNPASGLLTEREAAVLAKLDEGLPNRTIGHQLGVSEHTVARHLANIFLKLDVGSRGAAVARARSLGLL